MKDWPEVDSIELKLLNAHQEWIASQLKEIQKTVVMHDNFLFVGLGAIVFMFTIEIILVYKMRNNAPPARTRS